jgi:ribokinase
VVREIDFRQITWLIINEIEGQAITGKTRPEEILQSLRADYPQLRVVLTLGEAGSVYQDAEVTLTQQRYTVAVKDTTAAGDTFTGYFLAGLSEGLPIEDVLRMSAKASSIAVTREGAVPSIPYRAEVLEALQA